MKKVKKKSKLERVQILFGNARIEHFYLSKRKKYSDIIVLIKSIYWNH